MRIKEVEFTEDEKSAISELIYFSTISEDRVYNRKGHEFIFDNNNLQFLKDTNLFITVELLEESKDTEAPDPPIVKSRSVILFKIVLIELESFYPVTSNLDYNFEESVKTKLIV